MNENSRIEDPSMKQDRIIAPTQEAPPTDRLMSLAYRGWRRSCASCAPSTKRSNVC
jgi:hypothetical protein